MDMRTRERASGENEESHKRAKHLAGRIVLNDLKNHDVVASIAKYNKFLNCDCTCYKYPPKD